MEVEPTKKPQKTPDPIDNIFFERTFVNSELIIFSSFHNLIFYGLY